MRRFLFRLLQLTWGLPQTLAGFLLFLYWLPRAERRHGYHGAIVTEWKTGGGISLGLFVFIPQSCHPILRESRELTPEESRQAVLVHEYGHCIQSLLLGPLYLIAVGVPSYLWANLPRFRRMRREKKLSYYAVYPENWANALGEWAAKEPSPGQALPVRRS